MKDYHIGGARTVDEYVESKLARFNAIENSFSSLFDMMFSERDNVFWEKSVGYRIVKTTYGESRSRILSKAARLRSMLGSTPADSIIGLYMQSSLDWIEAFWAILASGCRPLLMNLRIDDGTLSRIISDYGVAAVISDGKPFGKFTIDAMQLADAPMCDKVPERFGSELFVMSSGTSSHVKICAYSTEQIKCQINDSCRIIREDRLMKSHYECELKHLVFLPFYHVFGLFAVYIWFSFFSRTFVQLNDLSSQTILNTIRRHKITHIFAVPLFWETVYEQAMRAIRERGDKTFARFERGLSIARRIGDVPIIGAAFKRYAFREIRNNLFGDSIRFMITGGSDIQRPVLEFFNCIGYHIADGYGMTEIGITSVELSHKLKYLCGGYVGNPMTSYEYRIGGDGELLVRGHGIASYIMENGKRTDIDEWFHTRDIAVCEHGHYRLLGRMDDLVVASSGENLNPSLVEPLISIPGAKGVCLVGALADGRVTPTLLVSVSRGISGERLTAVRQSTSELLSALNLSSQISRVEFITDDLIKKDDFKLNRSLLAREYAAGHLHAVTPETIVEEPHENRELIRDIRAVFAASLGKQPDDIGFTSDFFVDEGGTSLDYFAMIMKLQEKYSITFPSAGDGTSPASIKALTEYISSVTSDEN